MVGSVGHDAHVLHRRQADAELAPQPAAGSEQSSVGDAKRGERAVVQRVETGRLDIVVEPGGEPVGAAFETAPPAEVMIPGFCAAFTRCPPSVHERADGRPLDRGGGLP